MGDTIQLIKDINWFIKPISSIFIFLFTTKTGMFVLGSIFVIYTIFSVINVLLQRELSSQSTRGNFARSHPPVFERLLIILQAIGKVLINVVMKLPVVLAAVFFFLFISGFSSALSSIETFMTSQVKNSEYRSVLRHFETDVNIAEIKVIDQTYNEFAQSASMQLSIVYTPPFNNSYTPKAQNLTLKGSELFIDYYLIDLKYSLIDAMVNLSVPIKIYTNELPTEQGISLELNDTHGLPFYYLKRADQIFGMSPEIFTSRLTELLSCTADGEKAKNVGIHVVKQTARQRAWKGSVFTLMIDQKGNLQIRSKVVIEQP